MEKYEKRRRAIIGPASLCIVGVLLCHPACGAEGGTSPYLKGYKDFFSGVLPTAPGMYIRDDVVYYEGNIDIALIGGRLAIDVKQWSASNILSPTVVTPLQILGGTYAFGAIVPFSKADVNVGIRTAGGGLSDSDATFNLDDINFNPIILGWNAGDFHWMAVVSIAAPLGAYNKNALANTGLNYWSVQPQFSITYFEPHSGWEASTAVIYVINTENHATDYRTGDIFHLDWAVGKQLTPAWKVGVVGYLMEQVTPDSGAGATLGAFKSSVWALGPAVNYDFEVNRTPLSLITKWTHEIEATNTFRGDTVTTAIAFKF